MSHGVGTLVKARGREWVVLPGSTEGLLKLRPLGGAQAEETGILTGLERVEPASFGLPDPAKVGDFRSCRSTTPGAPIRAAASRGYSTNT